INHFQVLLRAQAITNQCYVVAAAQTGQHNEKRSSFGHSMVVDPWGTVVAQCNEGVGFCLASIDLNYLANVRKNLPCFEHRRLDLYDVPSQNNDKFFDPDQSATYTFGQVLIPSSHVFVLTHLSFAFVNIKPVLPGHVELSDLFKCVHRIEKELEMLHNVTSTTLCIQDGPDAGQSINHVHVHIIPRQKGDFGDEIYRKIATHDKEKKGQKTIEEMTKEAAQLRKLFYYAP
uniref:Bis(5'-adenosyl)-triphosphatase n=1 Tax=Romanomermis culicivorax TaxID=13658 RepID=A0A915IQJ8_ROMCU